MANPQQGDVSLFQVDDNGEICVDAGVVAMDGGLQTAAYLSLFGGNEDDSGLNENILEWWGNGLETEPAKKYRSQFQFITNGSPLISGNLNKFEQAAIQDLQWLLDLNIASEITVEATIPQLNRLALTVKINAFGELSVFNFTENWLSPFIKCAPFESSSSSTSSSSSSTSSSSTSSSSTSSSSTSSSSTSSSSSSSSSGAPVCPSDCTPCPNTLTATVTCPSATFPGPIIFTKLGPPAGCSWLPGVIAGYSITSLDCILAANPDPCGTVTPSFDRFAFCISVVPGGEACDTLGTNIDFHKAVSAGCPDTGLYVSSKAGWTCSIS